MSNVEIIEWFDVDEVEEDGFGGELKSFYSYTRTAAREQDKKKRDIYQQQVINRKQEP
jgi:hypothetical protein